MACTEEFWRPLTDRRHPPTPWSRRYDLLGSWMPISYTISVQEWLRPLEVIGMEVDTANAARRILRRLQVSNPVRGEEAGGG